MDVAQSPLETSEDEVPALRMAAASRSEDLRVLGRHLLCDDNSAPDDLDRVPAGAPIQVVDMDARASAPRPPQPQ